jgi:hypothetical protein
MKKISKEVIIYTIFAIFVSCLSFAVYADNNKKVDIDIKLPLMISTSTSMIIDFHDYDFEIYDHQVVQEAFCSILLDEQKNDTSKIFSIKFNEILSEENEIYVLKDSIFKQPFSVGTGKIRLTIANKDKHKLLSTLKLNDAFTLSKINVQDDFWESNMIILHADNPVSGIPIDKVIRNDDASKKNLKKYLEEELKQIDNDIEDFVKKYDLKKIALEKTAGAKTKKEKVNLLGSYLLFEFDQSDTTDFSKLYIKSNETLKYNLENYMETGKGDCYTQAYLAQIMLRLIGIESVIHPAYTYVEEINNYYSHAFLVVSLDDKDTLIYNLDQNRDWTVIDKKIDIDTVLNAVLH